MAEAIGTAWDLSHTSSKSATSSARNSARSSGHGERSIDLESRDEHSERPAATGRH
jgi:hypothetical protein